MGCGGSSPAKPEHVQQMCSTTARDLMIVCVQKVLDSAVKDKGIKISAPINQVDDLNKLVATLRKAGEDGKSGISASAAAAGEKVGGMFGGAIGGFVASAGSMVGSGAGGTLNTLADGVESGVKEIDSSFSTVAAELVDAKKDEIIAVYNDVIQNSAFPDAYSLCRGKEYKYATCPPDRISSSFMIVAGALIKEKLSAAVKEEVKKKAAVKYWDAAITKYNAGCGMMQDLMKGDPDAAPPKLEFDINNYIVEQVVAKLSEAMAAHEAAVRAKPGEAGAKRPASFCICLSDTPITNEAFNLWTQGQ
eukprot:CAMPEP_0115092298 /NCGR_PEP_ID=MMETSP0227-20121206/26672_1 /TAXON_ID=89957 /ORGANISM="Polarella glacialis, Strain CCMP 1383" /LENGTH=304 /DNA_ID=CAMNT_0002484069 /DNA_START=90 /DNA_END=1004 /DNA_ORIENTATION=-